MICMISIVVCVITVITTCGWHSYRIGYFCRSHVTVCRWYRYQDRTYSYTQTDTSQINVMLNSKDVSEYLKLSPNGLEVCWLVDGCLGGQVG